MKPVFLARFLGIFSGFSAIFTLLSSKHEPVIMLGTVFPLTVISKCRKWHLRGTYLEIFPRGICPWTPLEDHAFSTGSRSKNLPLFSWQDWNLWWSVFTIKIHLIIRLLFRNSSKPCKSEWNSGNIQPYLIIFKTKFFIFPASNCDKKIKIKDSNLRPQGIIYVDWYHISKWQRWNWPVK